MESIGKIVLIGKGTYNASTTYTHLDWVRYDGKSWVCKQDNTVGVTPTEGAYWTLLAQDGANGQDGHDGHDGQDGQGVPTGGTTGQVLAKASNTDYDTVWVNGGGGGGSDDEQLIRDTVGWTGKNIVEEFTASSDTEQYKNALYAKGELEADTDYIISFDAASGNQYYTNENLFSEVTITTTGSTVSAQARTVSSVSKSDANQYNATYGWRILKNKVAQSSAPSFTNVMIRKATVTDSTYEPYHASVKDYMLPMSAMNVLGAKNVVGTELLSMALVGGSTTGYKLEATTNGLSYVAELAHNVRYVASKGDGAGNRFRICLFNNYPTTTYESGSTEVVNNDSLHEYSFNSGTYNYAVFTVNKTEAYTYDNIKAMLRLAEYTDATYEPYAETNQQLTANKLSYADNGILGAKNLCESRLTSDVELGITFTKNSDGSYSISGTNDGTGNSNSRINQSTAGGTDNLKNYKGYYTLTIADENGNNVSGIEAFIMQNTTWEVQLATASGKASGYIDANNCFICIQVVKDKSFSSAVTVYPMLRLASDPDNTYVPYAMTNKELTDAVASATSPAWSDVSSKPFNTVNSGSFAVSDNDLRLAGNRVHSISRYASDGTSTTYGYRGISASYTTPTGTSNTSDAIVEYVMKQTATSSSYTFTNSTAITNDRLIDVYSSLDEDYESVSQSGSTVTVTFAESKNRTVAIVLK